MDLSIFAMGETWATMFALIFLEIVLGVDNLVFIAITCDRLPPEKQSLGRRIGLLGALLMRILFLSFASFLVHMTDPLFTLSIGSYSNGVSVRDLVLFCGGIYLVWKGVQEMREMFASAGSADDGEGSSGHTLGLARAVATIMVMDVVFSIDSVITAVGLADYLIIMIIAVITAVIFMLVFINQVADFINRHASIKLLALVFIIVIGVLLVTEGLSFSSGIHAFGMELEKLVVYAAMVFALVIELLQMRYRRAAEGNGGASQ